MREFACVMAAGVIKYTLQERPPHQEIEGRGEAEPNVKAKGTAHQEEAPNLEESAKVGGVARWPIVLIKKKTGDIRVCIEFRQLHRGAKGMESERSRDQSVSCHSRKGRGHLTSRRKKDGCEGEENI